VTTTDYKGSRDVHVTPGCNSNVLDTIHDTNAKNGGAVPRQILDVQLFQRFLLILHDFGHGTNSIVKAISLPFEGVQEHLNWMSFVNWALVLIWTVPGCVGLCIFKLFQQFCSNPILVGPKTHL
jgi:hypothetical protein